MNKYSGKEAIKVVGIDLSKRSFQSHGVDKAGHKVMDVKLSRARLMTVMNDFPPCLVAMETCGSAHYWARQFRSQGHEARLIAPQFVKPYVKSNKNDAAWGNRFLWTRPISHATLSVHFMVFTLICFAGCGTVPGNAMKLS